jgi:hypothetical protein
MDGKPSKEDPLPFRRHLSFANVTAALALFVALGGTGYAAISIPANSVGGAQIRPNAVGASEIRASAVGRSEIRAGGVASSEIARDGVGASEIRRGAVGSSEIHNGAVRGGDIKNGTIASIDIGAGAIEPANLSTATRATFQATALRVAVDADGTAVAGNAKTVTHTADSGQYAVTFDSDVSGCFYSATPAKVKTADPDRRATLNVASGGTSAPDDVLVNTFDTAGNAFDEPFQLIVLC